MRMNILVGVGLVGVGLLVGCVGNTTPSTGDRDGDDDAVKEGKVASAASTDPTFRPSRIHVTPPVLDIDALHQRWSTQFVPPDPCSVWKTYKIGSPKNAPANAISVASIGVALETTRTDTTACGPVIYVGSGRWTETPLQITKPTILTGDVQGGTNVVLSATIASTAGQPLWLQDVVIDDAPFPGAIFASHWSDETMLLRVLINQAHGVGVIQNGGVLSMYLSQVRNGIVATNPWSDTRVNQALVLSGFNQPAANANPIRNAPVPHYLDSVISLMTDDLGSAGPSVAPYVAEKRITQAYTPFNVNNLVALVCSGTGAVVQGGLSEIAATTYVANHGAGFAIISGFVTGLNLGTGLNGITPHDDSQSKISGLLNGSGCYGGIHVHSDGGMLVEGGGAIANQPVGLGVAKSAELVWGTMTTDDNIGWVKNGWGDGVTTDAKSYASFTDLEADDNGRVGALFGSNGNMFAGNASGNQFGLVIESGSKVYRHGFTASNNPQGNIVDESGFAVPTQPAQMPQ